MGFVSLAVEEEAWSVPDLAFLIRGVFLDHSEWRFSKVTIQWSILLHESFSTRFGTRCIGR